MSFQFDPFVFIYYSVLFLASLLFITPTEIADKTLKGCLSIYILSLSVTNISFYIHYLSDLPSVDGLMICNY